MGKDAVPALLESGSTSGSRGYAYHVQVLADIGTAAVPALVDVIRQGEAALPFKRDKAEHALKIIGGRAVPAIAELLDHPDVEVQKNAARLLGRIGVSSMSDIFGDLLPKLLGGLGKGYDEHLMPCIHVAGIAAIQPLERILENGPGCARSGAVLALCLLAEKYSGHRWETSIRLLTKLLRSHPETEVQNLAANAIAKMAASHNRYEWKDTISALKDAADGGVMEAIDALGQIPDRSVFPLLARFLVSKVNGMERRAAEALGEAASRYPEDVAYAIAGLVNGDTGDRMIEINARNDWLVHAINGIMLRCAKAMENAA